MPCDDTAGFRTAGDHHADGRHRADDRHRADGSPEPGDWHVLAGLDDFLARAGAFLRSEPALHTVPLTVTEALRTRGPHVHGDGAPEFGVLEREGAVRAAFLRTPPHRLHLTSATGAQAEALAARLADPGRPLPGVIAGRRTAAAFAGAWRHRTGATVTLHKEQRLYRLGTLTVPRPSPPGRPRTAGPADRDHLVRWYGEFCAAVGETAVRAPAAWADARIERGDVTFWEGPDGAPAAMACTTPEIAGQVRVGGVYTPPGLRGRGCAGAATAAASRAALAAGAREVLLFTDLADPVANRLYRRIGYRPVADFAVYDFG
ncbi:GNAT family N-acetyltransferase [Streptomyces sp. NPDC085946]|uniref:GNAT family N-acetyltransferase n=1 Tax=Streptomyces sp. NPDC085946 TaxID=3365744 RepID=UPI0037CF4FD6